jgi:outer membrane protein TolC
LQGVTLTSLGASAGGGNGVSSGGGIVTQLGPQIPSLDPNIIGFANFQHATSPQSNTVLTNTTAFIQNTRTFQAQYQQNFVFGLTTQVTYASQYTKVNSQFFSLNPFTTGDLDVQVTQNLLQGFGAAVNGRNIRVQKNNLKVTDLQFKQQVITTVAAILNLYWDLVSFHEDLRARRTGVQAAQQLLDDNKKQVDIGSLAGIEVTRAEAQLYASQQDFVISQTNLLQQEIVLKNALSRNGVASPDLAEVHVIPLDTIAVPDKNEIRPVEELVGQALNQRVEIEQGRINVESNKLNLVGIKNSLKPTLQAFAELTNNGLSGDITALGLMQPGVGYLAGGYGNLLAQIFRRNYPNYSAGFSLNIPLRNRAAQSDYVTSLIEIRQNELSLQKNINQVRVDVQNSVIGLQQARARYDAAVKARVLQQQTLDADQKKQALGATTVYQVIQDQRDLATSQSAEVQATANYTHARIAFDQAMGTTLESNNVSLQEALVGQISRPSTLPATLPEGEKP